MILIQFTPFKLLQSSGVLLGFPTFERNNQAPALCSTLRKSWQIVPNTYWAPQLHVQHSIHQSNIDLCPMAPKGILTEEVIKASPEKVWAILTDLDAYESWNPFIISAKRMSPILEQGARLEVHIKPPGKSASKFTPILEIFSPNKELKWRGSLPIPGLFVGRHYFRLEPIDASSTKFVHGEDFTGLLVPLLGGMLTAAEKGFKEMNTALKQRAESI